MHNKLRMEDFLVISSGRFCCSKSNYSVGKNRCWVQTKYYVLVFGP